MKYRLTEEQLNSLIAESTIRVLREASEDEGIGGALGKGLGWLARKTANGFKDFGKNFGQQWGGQAQGQENNTETEQQSLTQMQQTIQTLSKQLASLQQIVNNGGGNTNAAGGGNTNAAGGGNTENGGNTAGGGNAENGGNAAGGGEAANGGNTAGGGQNNAEILARQKAGNAATTPQNRPVNKDSSQNTMANLMRNSVAKGNMEEANRKHKKQISEAKLNQIVSESIRKILNGK